MRVLPLLLILLPTMSVARAQATHLVGPGGHAQINDAIAVASPGDIIVVMPGSYQVFTLGIGLTIRAAATGTVTVLPGWGSVLQVPAGQTAHLVGLQMSWVIVSAGRVTLDECTVTGGGAQVAVMGGAVHLQGCTLLASPTSLPQATLWASQSEVTAVDCTIAGADGTLFGPPSTAVNLIGSTLRGSSLTVRGGTGSPYSQIPGVIADATSTVWISDSAITSFSAACPIVATHGRQERNTLTPNCSGIPVGNVLGIHRLGVPQNGGQFMLEFRSAPGSLVGVWAALDLATSTVPLLEQSLLLPPPNACASGVFITDAAGIATGTWAIPAGPVAVDRTLWFQAFGGPGFPLQASAVAGGLVR